MLVKVPLKIGAFLFCRINRITHQTFILKIAVNVRLFLREKADSVAFAVATESEKPKTLYRSFWHN